MTKKELKDISREIDSISTRLSWLDSNNTIESQERRRLFCRWDFLDFKLDQALNQTGGGQAGPALRALSFDQSVTGEGFSTLKKKMKYKKSNKMSAISVRKKHLQVVRENNTFTYP